MTADTPTPSLRPHPSPLQRIKDVSLVVALAGLAFVWGRQSSPALEASSLPAAQPLGSSPSLAVPAQGRTSKRGSTAASVPLVYDSGSGGSGAAGGLIAVTGSYGVGTSVLYLIDAEKRQLAVYEARGGSQNSRKLTLVGARRIDLDLQLEGYNDESEFSYGALLKKFDAADVRSDKAPDRAVETPDAAKKSPR